MIVHQRVPVIPGLFEVVDDRGPALVGSRCEECGTYYFPTTLGCRNPTCEGDSLMPAHLGRRGTLYSFSVQRYRPPPIFRIDDWKPYALGLVDVTEGPRILAILATDAFDEIAIGMPMELVINPLFIDEEGQHVVHQYRPVTEGTN